MSDETQSDAPSGERIAKVMARAGVASRRDAERLILEGRVSVNGLIVTSPALDVMPGDRVILDGKPIDAPQPARLWLYYKPLGLVTSEKDEKGRQTVFESLPDGMPRVMSVGRLDLNSEGLLLLTNDGELKRRLELPSTGWLRKYRVRVNGRPNEATFDPLRRGITIEGEEFLPMDISLDRQQGANAWLTVGLREGRNREIRRAMTEVGLTVNRLIRVSYGPFRLNEMKPGDVIEVKQRVLREQLGERQSGDDEKAGGTAQRKGRPDRRDGDRPARPSRDGERPARPARDGDRPARPPRDGDRPARPPRAAAERGAEDSPRRRAPRPDGERRPAYGEGDRPARTDGRAGKPVERSDRGERGPRNDEARGRPPRRDGAPDSRDARPARTPRSRPEAEAGAPREERKPRHSKAGPGGPKGPRGPRDSEGRSEGRPDRGHVSGDRPFRDKAPRARAEDGARAPRGPARPDRGDDRGPARGTGKPRFGDGPSGRGAGGGESRAKSGGTGDWKSGDRKFGDRGPANRGPGGKGPADKRPAGKGPGGQGYGGKGPATGRGPAGKGPAGKGPGGRGPGGPGRGGPGRKGGGSA